MTTSISIIDKNFDEKYSCEQLKGALSEVIGTIEAQKRTRGSPAEDFRQTAATISSLDQFSAKKPRTLKHQAAQNKILHSTMISQGKGSIDGSVLTVHQNGLAIARDLNTGLIYEAIQVTQGSVMALTASPSGSLMVVGGLSCTVDVYPINEALQTDLSLERTAHEFNYHSQQESESKPYLQTTPALQTSSNNNQYTAKTPNTIQLQRELTRIDPKKALESVTFHPRVTHPSRYVPRGYNNVNNYCASLIGHQSSITSIEFLHEYQVCSGSADGAAMVWDVDSGVATNLFRGHEGSVNALQSLSPQTFVSVGSDGFVLLWDTRASGSQTSFQASQSVALNFCESAPNSGCFVAAGRNHLDIFDIRAGECLINYATENHNISSLGISRSGRLLLAGSNSGRCVIFDCIKGQTLGELNGHTGAVCGSHFSGPNIITTGHDSLVKNWVHKRK